MNKFLRKLTVLSLVSVSGLVLMGESCGGNRDQMNQDNVFDSEEAVRMQVLNQGEIIANCVEVNSINYEPVAGAKAEYTLFTKDEVEQIIANYEAGGHEAPLLDQEDTEFYFQYSRAPAFKKCSVL